MKTLASRKLVLLVAAISAVALAWVLISSYSFDSFGLGGIVTAQVLEKKATSTVEAEGLLIHANTGSAPVKVLQTGTMTVNVSDSDGQPVSGAELEMVVDMKNMHHLLPKVVLTETSPGIYVGEFVPVMPGKWIAVMKADTLGQTVTFSHSFTVSR